MVGGGYHQSPPVSRKLAALKVAVIEIETVRSEEPFKHENLAGWEGWFTRADADVICVICGYSLRFLPTVLQNIDFGFAAGCEAVASPRRRNASTFGAMPFGAVCSQTISGQSPDQGIAHD